MKLIALVIFFYTAMSCATTKKPYEGYFESEELRLSYVELRKQVKGAPMSALLEGIRDLRKKWPDDIYLESLEAVMEGDVSQVISAYDEAVSKEKAAEKIGSLVGKVSHLNPMVLYIMRNEIAYHSQDYYQQYLLGKEEAAGSYENNVGSFSIGVGASEHAFSLLKQGYIAKAQKFAREAVKAWESFPDPWQRGDHFYTQALAISGQESLAEESFKKINAKSIPEEKLWEKNYRERLDLIKKSLSKNPSDWPPAVIVQKQVEAYNSNNVKKLNSYLSPKLMVYHPRGTNKKPMKKEGFIKSYKSLIAKSPDHQFHVVSRQVIGQKVIDHVIHKPQDGKPSRSNFVLYSVENGLITEISMIY